MRKTVLAGVLTVALFTAGPAAGAAAAPAPPPASVTIVTPKAPPRPRAAPRPSPSGSRPTIACPIGAPRSYADTWGAPRPGGRSHEGVDIIAPWATPLYAYESGVVSSTAANTLGGLALHLAGDSGAEYYYAHLSGHVLGVVPGTRVHAGQAIAFNGNTGNAGGTPTHVHFEIRLPPPPGLAAPGTKVNPFPYVLSACG